MGFHLLLFYIQGAFFGFYLISDATKPTIFGGDVDKQLIHILTHPQSFPATRLLV